MTKNNEPSGFGDIRADMLAVFEYDDPRNLAHAADEIEDDGFITVYADGKWF